MMIVMVLMLVLMTVFMMLQMIMRVKMISSDDTNWEINFSDAFTMPMVTSWLVSSCSIICMYHFCFVVYLWACTSTSLDYNLFIIIFLLSVPQKGTLFITTEFGKLQVKPNEICVIQVRRQY